MHCTNYKMIYYEKVVAFDKEGVKCMICNYYYSKMDYQSYVCNGCHDFSMEVMNLSDFFILNIGGVDYRVYIVGVLKKKH